MMTVNDVLVKMSVPTADITTVSLPVRLRIESFDRFTDSLGAVHDVHLWAHAGGRWVNAGMALDCTENALDMVGHWDGSEEAVYRALFEAAGIRLSSLANPPSPIAFSDRSPQGIDVNKLSGMLPPVACDTLHFEEVFNPVNGRFETVKVYIDAQPEPAFTFSRNALNMTLECSDILRSVAIGLGLLSEVELSFSEDVFDSQVWNPTGFDEVLSAPMLHSTITDLSTPANSAMAA